MASLRYDLVRPLVKEESLVRNELTRKTRWLLQLRRIWPLPPHRLVDNAAEVGVGRGAVALRLDHKHGVQLVLAVDPELGAVRAAPRVTAVAVHCPAEAVLLARHLEVVLEHQVDALFLQHPHAVEFAAAQDHGAEPGVVRRGAVEGVAAHERGRLIAERLTVLRLLQHARFRLPVQRGQPADLLLGHPEVGVGHLQRGEQLLLYHLIEGFAGDRLDVPAEDVERQPVLVALAGVELERFLGQRLGEVLERRPLLAGCLKGYRRDVIPLRVAAVV
jgi:hypothetical protein